MAEPVVPGGALAPALLEPHLRGRFGTPYLWEPECASTQLLLLGSGLPEGAVAATDHQTAGRGRLGRRWDAPPGSSVLCSVLLRPPAERPLPELALVGGIAAAEAVERLGGVAVGVKWPNDLVVDGRKLGGVLAEARDETVVLGVGINVSQTAAQLPPGTTLAPASLRTVTGAAHDPAVLLAGLLERLEHHYLAWQRQGLDAIREELRARDALRGLRVRVDAGVGVADGVAADGRLRVLIDGTAILVASGEVVLVG